MNGMGLVSLFLSSPMKTPAVSGEGYVDPPLRLEGFSDHEAWTQAIDSMGWEVGRG